MGSATCEPDALVGCHSCISSRPACGKGKVLQGAVLARLRDQPVTLLKQTAPYLQNIVNQETQFKAFDWHIQLSGSKHML